jgi:hypothetical protein
VVAEIFSHKEHEEHKAVRFAVAIILYTFVSIVVQPLPLRALRLSA